MYITRKAFFSFTSKKKLKKKAEYKLLGMNVTMKQIFNDLKIIKTYT